MKGKNKCEEVGKVVRKQEMAAKRAGFVPGGEALEEGRVNKEVSEDQLDVLQYHGEVTLHIVFQSIHETVLPARMPACSTSL